MIRIKEKLLNLLLPILRPAGYYAVRSLDNDPKRLINRPNPVVVDGGASRGEFTREVLSRHSSPIVYCFEANPDLADNLKQQFKDKTNVHIVMKAIGSQAGEMSFNISKYSPSSSFLEQSDLHREYHGDFNSTEKSITVPMVRLSDELKDQPEIDLLKLDLEGYELEALKGAAEILPRTRIIMTEVWFVESYKGAPYFSDIDAYLRQQGFVLLNLYNPYTHLDMQLTAADAVFINQAMFADRKHFG